jgi:hypothetical protein
MIEKELREQLTGIQSETIVFGASFVALAAALAAAATLWILAQPEMVREALAEMLRL